MFRKTRIKIAKKFRSKLKILEHKAVDDLTPETFVLIPHSRADLIWPDSPFKGCKVM